MKFQILLLLLAFWIFPSLSPANHLVGGEIYYEYISDIDSNQSIYRISLISYNEPPLSPPNTLDVTYTSSCHGGGTMNVNLIQQGSLFQYDECISSGGVIDVLYQGLVTLPKRCSDWKFDYTSACCLSGPFQNVIFGNINYAFTLTAKLNNLNQNSSSARYADPPSHHLCQNLNNFYWRQRATEPDTDSLVYRINDPIHQWNQGYSRYNPFGSPGGMVTDSLKGVYVFKPAYTGSFILLSSVEDYRLDSVSGNQTMVGSIQRFMIVEITSNCDSSLINWGLNVNDSLVNIPMEVDCGSTRIGLKASSKFACSTLTHTDFIMHQPDATVLPIVNANGNCANGFSDSLFLDFHTPMQQNGDYLLISKQGFDGNTIISGCGFSLAANDTILIQVKNCNNISYTSNSIDQVIEVFPNPANNFIEITGLDANSNASEKRYTILSGNGQLIMSDFLEDRIDVSKLVPGIYFLQIKESGKIASITFSKQ